MRKTMQYVAYFKPYGVLSQFTGGSSPGDTLEGFGLPPDIYAAGRLDKDSEGLLLLTNDGKFISELLSPLKSHPRTYWVQVEGIPDAAALTKLAAGVVIGGYKTKKALVEILPFIPPFEIRNPPIRFRQSIPTTWLALTLYEGKNRQVRRMTAAVGFPTLRLVRVKIGKYSLIIDNQELENKMDEGKKGVQLMLKLKPGEWKEITLREIL